jgi:hypothetical protein
MSLPGARSQQESFFQVSYKENVISDRCFNKISSSDKSDVQVRIFGCTQKTSCDVKVKLLKKTEELTLYRSRQQKNLHCDFCECCLPKSFHVIPDANFAYCFYDGSF